MADRDRQLGAILLIATVVLAFGLRAYRLDSQSLWYDEGVTAQVAQRSMVDLTRWTARDIQPPLYYYIAAAWGRAAGWSEWSLRFISVFFGVLTTSLMYILAAARARDRLAGYLAALLTALHPLLLYYSQEARMYALLTALAILAGYCLQRAGRDNPRWQPWLAYILIATAAIYTHYFAFFLLLALGFAFLWEHYRDRSRTRRFVLANGVALLLYVPWFSVLFTRLSVDNSYWQGQLKLWDALRNVATSFTTGETVAAGQATVLMAVYALLTAVALASLLRISTDGKQSLRYALLWLIVPVTAVLILASFAPKFNARYVMISLPGLLLIWSIGFTRLIKVGNASPNWPPPSRLPLRTALPVSLAVALLCAGFVYADANWFTDPAFSKDQWREVSQYLRPRIEEHEAIVLVSGHAWPVWAYYAPDLPVIRLPDIETLDVDAVLDFSDTAGPMQTALESLSDRPGAYLIGWQDNVVDPTGVVPTQLEIAGREKGLSAHFWGLTLRRFSQLKPHWIPDQAPIQTVTDIDFGGQLALRGYTAVDNGDLLLFWQRQPGVDLAGADFKIAGTSYDTNESTVAHLQDRRLAGYDYPSFRWPVDRVVLGHLSAAGDWLGDHARPGTYIIELSVYDASDPSLARLETFSESNSVRLGPIEVHIE